MCVLALCGLDNIPVLVVMVDFCFPKWVGGVGIRDTGFLGG